MRRRARSVQNRFTKLQNNLLNYHKEERKKEDTDDNTLDEDKGDIVMSNDDNKEGKGNISGTRIRID